MFGFQKILRKENKYFGFLMFSFTIKNIKKIKI